MEVCAAELRPPEDVYNVQVAATLCPAPYTHLATRKRGLLNLKRSRFEAPNPKGIAHQNPVLPALRSAFLTAVALLAKGVDEGGRGYPLHLTHILPLGNADC